MKKILVVDDAVEVREMLDDFFKLEGYSVIQAENGLQGLEIFKKEKPDAAIVDIEMPQMNGLEFAKKALEYDPDFPIIIVSAFVEKYSLDYINNLGVKVVLRKPIDLTKLAKEVKRLFSKSKSPK
ncbi:MAG: response regulator [Calditrichaeota bacterium]|nr:response regulator [Calditrichota bacterium]